MDLSVGFGIFAALCWGSSDFVVKLLTQRIGYLRVALFLQYIGGVFLLLITFQSVGLLWRFPTETYIALGLGAVNALATISFFKSFEVGRLNIVAPVASGYPALTAILAVFLLHETISPMLLIGIVAILVGMIFVSLESKEKGLAIRKRAAAGVGYALIAFLCMGFFYFATKFTLNGLGSFLPVLMVRLVSALILSVMAVSTAKPAIIRSSNNILMLGFVGLADSVAIMAYNLGISTGAVTVVSTLSGLFSAVTVLLACVILKERLTLRQGVGVLAILVGVGIVSYLT